MWHFLRSVIDSQRPERQYGASTTVPGPALLAMDPFVQPLADLCRAHVTRSKWVFVPTHAVGRTIGERIALGGTGRFSVPLVRPTDLAP